MKLHAATVTLSAFLLFLVEPMIARLLVPSFGGSAAVWTTCLLFFQIVLLLGYLYAHWSATHLRFATQARLHLILLPLSLIPLLALLRPISHPKPGADPALQILLILAGVVGLPYFLLSSTTPLLQSWYRHTVPAGSADRGSYWFYALSNTGSMVALLGYPAVVEPRASLWLQRTGWTAGYGLFAVCCGAVALRAARLKELPLPADAETTSDTDAGERPGFLDYTLWLALSACSSVLLLATTTHLTQNVAAIPLLWVLPLALYLLTFIICFSRQEWRWSPAFLALPPLAIGGLAYASSSEFHNAPIGVLIPLICSGLFIVCLFCHGELARRKPGARYLTSFYLTMSFGGALGGLFVALIAPRIFNNYYELQIGIGMAALLALWLLYREPGPDPRQYGWLTLGAMTVGLLVWLAKDAGVAARQSSLLERSFYGVLHVTAPSDPSDEGAVRSLTNGTIMHGEQFTDPAREMEPISYYAPVSGVGLAIKEAQKHGPVKIGVVGLGTGTIAAYGRVGDQVRYYELNPQVLDVANGQFTFVGKSKARVTTALGDARLSLESEPPQGYDVLCVDAFSSDSIPVHLLTREAFALYFRHLKPGGVLAVHVSNRYVNLVPVVKLSADGVGAEARLVDNDEDDENHVAASSWVLVTHRGDLFADPLLKKATAVPEPKRLRPWTDDYSNLFQVLKKKD